MSVEPELRVASTSCSIKADGKERRRFRRKVPLTMSIPIVCWHSEQLLVMSWMGPLCPDHLGQRMAVARRDQRVLCSHASVACCLCAHIIHVHVSKLVRGLSGR
jgi:hypothetical protein